jgi:hypothetical protein
MVLPPKMECTPVFLPSRHQNHDNSSILSHQVVKTGPTQFKHQAPYNAMGSLILCFCL